MAIRPRAFRMLNPINRTTTRAGVQRYKVEPYVVAGDVYAEASACGPRRLDLVHRFGRLAVSRRARMDLGFPRAWTGHFRSIPAFRETGRVTTSSSIITPLPTRSRWENPSSVTRGVAFTELDGTLLAGSPRFTWWTTARCIRCASYLGEHGTQTTGCPRGHCIRRNSH